MAQFADIWYTANGANYGRNQHYNDSRYHMLNYHATFTKGTIEFRLFQFDKPANGRKNGLHAGQLKSYTVYSIENSGFNELCAKAYSTCPSFLLSEANSIFI